MSDNQWNYPVQAWRTEQGHASYPVVSTTDNTFWLQNLDISPEDFPYIEPLLQESLSDWQQQNSSQTRIGNAHWFLFNHMHKYIGGDQTSDHLIPQIDIAVLDRSISNEHLIEYQQEQYQFTIVPIYTRHHQKPFAMMGCIQLCNQSQLLSKEEINMLVLHYKSLFYRRFEYTFIADMLHSKTLAEREAQRRSVLFQVIQRMHDKFEVDALITELFAIVGQMYPQVEFELLVSQDNKSNNPKVKPLLLQNPKEDMCVRAFTAGQPLIEVHSESSGLSDRMEVAIPLSGKQAIYGVFHLLSDYPLEEEDIELMRIMAEAAGRTFENAKLYEQSQLLNEDLRLINEITRRLNQSLQLNEIFDIAGKELLDVFKAETVAVLHLNPETEQFEVVTGNVPSMEGKSVGKDHGYTGLLYRTKEPVILSDYCNNPSLESLFMNASGSCSMIASPLIGGGEVKGSIFLGHRKSHYFSYGNFKLLQVITTHIGLAVDNATLHDEVRRMASRDALTGLYLRRYLDEKIQSYQSKEDSGALLMVDIDKFKQVNDTYGHQIGDEILKQVSLIIQSSIREGDIAARWGGEELAVYFPQIDAEKTEVIAERIREKIENETHPTVTVSCGIAAWDREDQKVSVESLFYRADMALYQAKKSGRNRICIDESPRE
ncbi:sensor domain-containing diguanylate cyclase [Paenibacillus sp. PK4536]|uniref:GGDEF domain-containing protein n=1 Tax=Paenibacillus nuruki TaxID=1886670 RepID=A0A1E3KZN2_9BACL|nr:MULTISPECIES: sensor domain-containing diguanylate cyclase [Paenibacillus]ODP26946.1 uncharacterized protein PTI45_03675 [Paenibacillus nuruki]TKJ94187.1 GGDEF domain-containing protein [Paenibacillus sp. CFBP13512]WIM38957.1 sensor domain-containing diguanylate cyclase [Paenibacillus sp. PK4536]CAJ1314357.1 GGDEF domain-containing protein [Paenibacillus nuruki]